MNDEGSRLERERAFLVCLLELNRHPDLDALLGDALRLITQTTGADIAYLEVAAPGGERVFSIQGQAEGHTETIRRRLSSRIIEEAIHAGETIQTPSALLDPRFSDAQSVRREKIESVLCAPVGVDGDGVLYLQGAAGAGPFLADDLHLVSLLAKHLAPQIRRLRHATQSTRLVDPTARFRRDMNLRGLVGRSPALAKVFGQVALVADVDAGVLLTGPSGTGKTALARAIHDNGPRRDGPFVEVSCALLPDELAENELFGARAGAHSTANRASPGKVRSAQGGTLFLDEIAELSPRVQAKLLQLLQSKAYYPLGSSERVEADVRVIAATNEDLEALVHRRLFREDLYYRLNVLPIRLPSLEERRDDIGLLADHFVEHHATSLGIEAPRLTLPARRHLASQSWPGNIRQLSNAVQAGVIRARGTGGELTRDVLVDAAPSEFAPPTHTSLAELTRDFQTSLVHDTLERFGGNRSEAARELGLPRSSFYALLKRLGIANS